MSVEQAMKRCTNGMFAEIKYDGERVQLHKHGNTFSFYSRSLKPVQRHKVRLSFSLFTLQVETCEIYVPQAFPQGGDLILDAEILLVEEKSGKPLPFGMCPSSIV